MQSLNSIAGSDETTSPKAVTGADLLLCSGAQKIAQEKIFPCITHGLVAGSKKFGSEICTKL